MSKTKIIMVGKAAALFGALNLMGTSPVEALTMKECSAKYRAAQTAGTLGGMTWQDFRKAQCGADASAATAAPAAPEVPAKTQKSKTYSSAAGAVFPTAIASKYTKESAGRARLRTCLDQYNANKQVNANGGLHWIQKGGGYYSECNKRLKG